MNSSLIIDKALKLHHDGQLDAAAVQYQLELKQNPHNPDALYGLGTILIQKNKSKDAIPILEQASKLAPNAPEFAFNLALALENTKDIPAATTAYLRAAELAKTDAQYMYNICQKLLKLNLPQQTYQYLKGLNSSDTSINFLMATALGKMEKWANATLILEKLDKETPNNPTILLALSRAAGHQRNYSQAINIYQLYLATKTIMATDWLAFADLYMMAHQPEKAKEAIKKAFDMGEQSAAAMLIAAKCARLEDEQKEAREYLKKALDKNPDFGEAWRLFFEFAENDELDDIAKQCRNLAKNGEGDVTNQVSIALTSGRAFEKLKKYNNAIDMFDLGNNLHKSNLSERNVAYDPVKSEVETDNIMQNFIHAPKTKSKTKSKTNGPQPLFILGMCRSGSTLVEKILAGLQGVEAGGENEALEHISNQYYFDVSKGNAPEPLNLNSDEWQALADQYWQRTTHNKPMITDKMPHNFRHIGLILAMFPKAPIIYTHRDPRDVSLSIYARQFPDGHSYACDLSSIAHFYGQSVKLMKHWQKIAPKRILEVRHEELVANPEAKTKEIAKFCGLNWEPDCLNFHKRQSHSYTFSELQVRKPLNSDGIGRWQNYKKAIKQLEPQFEKHSSL